jgi:DNA-directed RNA polymerase subunit omega
MAQEGYDTLMELTDSRYRLSMIVARRAAQLKTGIPSTLDQDALAGISNTVTIAMKELELGAGIKWGDELPAISDLRRVSEPTRRPDPEFSVSAPLAQQ